MLNERFPVLRPRLLAICRALVGDFAEDVVQETYVQGRGRLHQLRDVDALEPWLTTIAVRACIDHHRGRRRLLDRLPLMHRAQSENITGDIALRQLIEALPARDRTILVLHYGYGYRLREVADLLALSPTNVRTIIARTRHRLLKLWKESTMTKCQAERAIHARLAREEPLSEAQLAHGKACEGCGQLIARAASLDAALLRSIPTLVVADLPTGTLLLAAAGRRPRAVGRLAVVLAGLTLVIGLAGAAAYAGLRPPVFDDQALRTDAAAFAVFNECLGRAGYTPRPITAGEAVPIADGELAYQRAMNGCLVESGIGEVDGDDPLEVAYANAVATSITGCLRQRGWDLPDPKLEPLGRYLVPPSGVVSDDPEVQSDFNRDLEACGSSLGIPFEE